MRVATSWLCSAVFLLSIFLLGCNAQAAPNTKTPIVNLPSYNGDLPSNMYSGYVTVNTTYQRALYYWFIESQNNPATDPLVLWLQGGPGCAGTWAIFEEHGPFLIQPGGELTLNTLSWTKTANVLYIDSPAGVGFSYSNTTQGLNTNDNQTADDTYAFLQGWYEMFPEFQQNAFWVNGESYGGVYGPMLVYNILTGPNTQILSSLTGLMLGNPVIDCEAERTIGLTTQLNLYFFHGLISFSDRQTWFNKGCDKNQTAECQAMFDQYQSSIGIYSPDNLYQNFCTGNGSTEFLATVPGCEGMGSRTENYLNRKDVQEAINARPTKWFSCTNDFLTGLNYTSDRPNMLNYYNVFFESLDIKIMIYSGDVDIDTVPHAQTQLCLSFLERPIQQKWTRWTVPGPTIPEYIPEHHQKDNITAGYIEVYDKYTYATVRGAGHEVPLYQPYFAYYLFNNFVNGGVF